VPYHADTDESEHTTGIGSSPGLSASEVRGEVELCVLISSPRTLVERYFVSFARYSDLLVENREIFIFHLYLAPLQGVTPWEFCENV